MENSQHIHVLTTGSIIPVIIAIACIIVLILYIVAVIVTNHRYNRAWSIFRSISFLFAIIFVWLSLVGPISFYGDPELNFTTHMVGHLLLGMLAPLLFAFAATITLVLRSLPTYYARKLSTILKSKLSQFFTHPVVTALLNIGGLWILYTTPLFSLMHNNEWVYWLVHIHVFVAGYLFTISIIYIDPIYHRKSIRYRAVILILALAGHSILSKYIYVNPPSGISSEDAERGSMLMYYGGDIIDAIMIFILCLHWYKVTRPKTGKDKGMVLS